MQRTNSTLIKLCPRSPDLACVENLFHMVGKILQEQAIERNLRRETFEEFQTRVINTFYSIPVETVNTLISTMPKRIDMVIRKKGARINLVPRSSLFLPRESTLVSAGHVSPLSKQLPTRVDSLFFKKRREKRMQIFSNWHEDRGMEVISSLFFKDRDAEKIYSLLSAAFQKHK